MAVSVVRYLLLVLLASLQTLLRHHGASADTKTFKDLFNSSSCAQPPFECPHPRIEYYLYTRDTQKKPLRLDVRRFESLHYSRFNKSHPTKIIIHGFGGGRNLIPSPDLRKDTVGSRFLCSMYCSIGKVLEGSSSRHERREYTRAGIQRGCAHRRPHRELLARGQTWKNHRAGSDYIFLHERQPVDGLGRNRRVLRRRDPHRCWHFGPVGADRTRGFLRERRLEPTRMRDDLFASDLVMRSHKGNALLHRVDHDKSRILGSSVRKSFLLPDRMVQTAAGGIYSDGRRRPSYSSRHLLSVNKRAKTVRPRSSRKKPANDKSEAIVLPPVLSLLKQLINIIIE
nr:uncharacterized protein LOC117218972 isoform X2 [Megalopta genalis]